METNYKERIEKVLAHADKLRNEARVGFFDRCAPSDVVLSGDVFAVVLRRENAGGSNKITISSNKVIPDNGKLCIGGKFRFESIEQPGLFRKDEAPGFRREGRWRRLGDCQPNNPGGMDPEHHAADAEMISWAEQLINADSAPMVTNIGVPATYSALPSYRDQFLQLRTGASTLPAWASTLIRLKWWKPIKVEVLRGKTMSATRDNSRLCDDVHNIVPGMVALEDGEVEPDGDDGYVFIGDKGTSYGITNPVASVCAVVEQMFGICGSLQLKRVHDQPTRVAAKESLYYPAVIDEFLGTEKVFLPSDISYGLTQPDVVADLEKILKILLLGTAEVINGQMVVNNALAYTACLPVLMHLPNGKYIQRIGSHPHCSQLEDAHVSIDLWNTPISHLHRMIEYRKARKPQSGSVKVHVNLPPVSSPVPAPVQAAAAVTAEPVLSCQPAA